MSTLESQIAANYRFVYTPINIRDGPDIRPGCSAVYVNPLETDTDFVSGRITDIKKKPHTQFYSTSTQ